MNKVILGDKEFEKLFEQVISKNLGTYADASTDYMWRDLRKLVNRKLRRRFEMGYQLGVKDAMLKRNEFEKKQRQFRGPGIAEKLHAIAGHADGRKLDICPRCGSESYTKSIFGCICGVCWYEPNGDEKEPKAIEHSQAISKDLDLNN